MLLLYRHLIQTFQFGYSSSLYTGFWCTLSFQFDCRLCCFYIDIWYRLSSLAIVLVCIQAFGIDFPVWLQAMLLLYRHLEQTFQFGYSFSLYTGFCHRLSFQFGYRLVAFIQTFGTDFPVRLQFQFVYWLLVYTFQFGYRQCCFYIEIWYSLSSLAVVLVCMPAFDIDFPVWLQAMLFLYRPLVQTFQFGYSYSLYTGFWYRLSNLDIDYIYYIEIWYRLSSSDIVLVCILAFGIDFPVWLQAIFFKYWHYVQTFQFGYSSSLYTGFCHRLSFPYGYRLCCFYIDIWYRHSSLAIVLVCILAFGVHFLSSLTVGYVVFIQTFGTDFPVRLQFQFVYWLLVQTFQFGHRQCCFYIDILCRLSSLAIALVCIQAFGIDFPVWLQAMLLLYRNLVQTFQFGCSSSLYTGF